MEYTKYIIYFYVGDRNDKMYFCGQGVFSFDITQSTFYSQEEAIAEVALFTECHQIEFHYKLA